MVKKLMGFNIYIYVSVLFLFRDEYVFVVLCGILCNVCNVSIHVLPSNNTSALQKNFIHWGIYQGIMKQMKISSLHLWNQFNHICVHAKLRFLQHHLSFFSCFHAIMRRWLWGNYLNLNNMLNEPFHHNYHEGEWFSLYSVCALTWKYFISKHFHAFF